MPARQRQLPQLSGNLFLTDGGLETTLIFHEGVELPDFAAFTLLKTPDGEAALRKYFRTYAEVAGRFGCGLILESATWRASADWGDRLGYTAHDLADANRAAIRQLEEIRTGPATERTPIVVSGCVGPRGDGYVADRLMSAGEAETYHRAQIDTFAGTAVDMTSAMTLNYVEEAIGVTIAAKKAGVPIAISFTVETDGNLPTGQTLQSAVEETDAATASYPVYYMINCAHPTHFAHVLVQGGSWLTRLRGVRANASRRSHAELNESPDLDIGDPVDLGMRFAAIRRIIPHLNVVGGCCGTDHRHIEQIAEACLAVSPTAA